MDWTTHYRGKAFVNGNDHYQNIHPSLDNAVNDAKSIYERSQELGFMLMPLAIDLEIDDFDKQIEEFLVDLNRFDVVVLYFAGHSFERNGGFGGFVFGKEETQNELRT